MLDLQLWRERLMHRQQCQRSADFAGETAGELTFSGNDRPIQEYTI